MTDFADTRFDPAFVQDQYVFVASRNYAEIQDAENNSAYVRSYDGSVNLEDKR